MVSSHRAQHQDDLNDWRIRHRYFLALGIMMDSTKSFDVLQLVVEPVQQQQQGGPPKEHDSMIPAHVVVAPGQHLTHLRVPKGAPMNSHATSLPIYIIALKGDHGQVDQHIKSLLQGMEQEEEGQAVLLDPPIRKDGSKHPATRRNPLLDQTKWNSSHTIYDCCVSSPGSSLSFCPFVKVQEIPGRHMYSERLLRTLWSTPVESAESMRRNMIEFMAEGYVPEGVFDETDFLERDGKMVHPVCVLLDEPQNARLKQLYYM